MSKPKLTAAEKAARKVERKRAELQKKELAAVGGPESLFANEAAEVTTGQAAWHLRRTKAEMVEHLHWGPAGKVSHALDVFKTVAGIEPEARRLLGDGWYAKLLHYCRRTFSPGYWYGFWCGVLSGDKEVVFGFTKVDDPAAKLGFRMVPAEVFPPPGWVPAMTKAEFYERWPYKEPALGPEPAESVELFAEVMARI